MAAWSAAPAGAKPPASTPESATPASRSPRSRQMRLPTLVAMRRGLGARSGESVRPIL